MDDAVIHDVDGRLDQASLVASVGSPLPRDRVSQRSAPVPVSTVASVSFEVAADAYDRFMGRYSSQLVAGGLTVGTFIQLVIDGLSAGSIYAALALAIVLVNQATGLINFAQGGMAVLAAYFAYSFLQWGVPLILAILLSMLASFVLGAWSSGS